MPPSPSRRTLLLAAAAPVTLSAPPVQAAPAAPAAPGVPAVRAAADIYDTLRLTWRDLLLGTGFTPTAEPYATKLADLGAAARSLRSAMAPASGSLWPDLPYADPEPDTDAESYTYSGNLGTSFNRLRTMAEAGMDRAVHRRPGWAASLSMASRRITYYENGNGEKLRAWHSGSGMLYWWGGDLANGQYSDGFWPTVDPRRLPGTTASRKALADGEGGVWGAARPDVRWVGGATDGTYAAVGQYLKGLSSTLLAKKSWFFLDDAVVCLGAGIHGRDGTGVESVVDNRNLGASGTHAFTVDGTARPTAPGWSATLTGARWAHLAGHAGYVFPGGATESGTGTATVSVSGPLRDGAVIDLTWNRPVASVTSRDPSVQVMATGSSLTLRVTPGTLGAVHRAVVRPG
ncbi:hypothetical protein GCM10010274_34520 [Streptomyces lavendofoliae]|uniref:Polysaccharide lyase family 8 central domain-containing protein n=1 Tax=Streptomyces lavendofoliae TaxID=67314 RepID=A0A918HYH9_9ACTN|nr:polysaccharide lyase family 8 super-sandwich domain-containing protein [Streptomyces lavendofoliae]GGU43685.1 hypothetical protein GCM10010274_34520 [Streptomyces lavendofoliae]